MRRQAGFTLIEVLIAAFVAAMAFGVLVSWMARNVRALGRAQEQQRALLLGEQKARDFDLELRQSGLVEPGVENGEFPEPDSDLGWEIAVEAWQFPLPADFDLETSPSPLFESTSRQARPEKPPLHRVSLRVFKLDDPDTDVIQPFLLFGVVPGESPTAPEGQPGVPAGTNAPGTPPGSNHPNPTPPGGGGGGGG